MLKIVETRTGVAASGGRPRTAGNTCVSWPDEGPAHREVFSLKFSLECHLIGYRDVATAIRTEGIFSTISPFRHQVGEARVRKTDVEYRASFHIDGGRAVGARTLQITRIN
jgi:hypothetical protein